MVLLLTTVLFMADHPEMTQSRDTGSQLEFVQAESQTGLGDIKLNPLFCTEDRKSPTCCLQPFPL